MISAGDLTFVNFDDDEKVIVKMELVNEFYRHWNNSVSEIGNNISNIRGYVYKYVEIDKIGTSLRIIDTLFVDDYIDIVSYKFGDADIVIHKFINETELLFVGYNSFTKNFIRSLIVKIGNLNNLLTLEISGRRYISYNSIGEPNYYNLENIWSNSINTTGYSLTNVEFKIKKYKEKQSVVVNIPTNITNITFDNITNIIHNNRNTFFYNRKSIDSLIEQNNIIYSSGKININNNRYSQIEIKNEIATIVSDDIFIVETNYLKNMIDIKKIDVGSNHTYIIDNNNEIYSFGDNTYQQLGLYDVIQYKSRYYIENITISLYNNNNEGIDWNRINDNYIPINENGIQLYINNMCDKYVIVFDYNVFSNINDYKILLMNELDSNEYLELSLDSSIINVVLECTLEIDFDSLNIVFNDNIIEYINSMVVLNKPLYLKIIKTNNDIVTNSSITFKKIDIYNNGNHIRDFTHVKDIVSGTILAAYKASNDDFHIGSGKNYSILEIAKMFVDNGATCLSVLTEEKYFLGKLKHIQDIKKKF